MYMYTRVKCGAAMQDGQPIYERKWRIRDRVPARKVISPRAYGEPNKAMQSTAVIGHRGLGKRCFGSSGTLTPRGD
jgi:hypothetical protein